MNDTAFGGAGNDQMHGMGGNDVLDGGDGNDVLYGGLGPIDAGALIQVQLTGITNGPSGNDSLLGGAGNDTIFGQDGDDTLLGGSGADSMIGGAGSDWASYAGGTGDVSVSLATGTGSGGDAAGDNLTDVENLIGGSGNDYLAGSTGANTILGGAGNDTIAGGAGADSMNGGTGTSDWLDYSQSPAVIVDLAGGTGSGGHAAGDQFTGFENVLGGAGADSVVGNGSNNQIVGGSGNDTLAGGGGDDTIDGGTGADVMDGGAGTGDWLDYSQSAGGVTADLGAGTGAGGAAAGDQFTAFENLLGGSSGDSLVGSDAANVINGGGGNDTIVGSLGNDTLVGGGGVLDRLDYSGSSSPISIDVGAGSVSKGEDGTDSISGFSQFVTGGGDDTVIAGAGNQDFDLGGGNNYFEWTPGDGDDTVRLGGDADTLDLQGWNGSDDDPWSTVGGAEGSVVFNNSGGGSVQVYGYDPENDFIACFAEGTMIATDRGEVSVESLRAGDLVLTMHGTPRLVPLRWVGVSRLNLAHQRNRATAAPILVRAGALMDGVPSRDLRLSPEHALFIDGMLVPARMLVNGETIVQEIWCREVAYYHLEIEGHGLLVSDGALSESYVDDGNRALFDNGTVVALSVDFEAHRANGRYAMQACAPIATEGPALRAIRQRLAQRAGEAAQVA
ncbi:hypothetical protein GXW78_19470 [Roseomonas terrae]|uniref:Hedgehog/Intein (Hint) domain-containing protein n=1 Tax=Neoroseomonas terrae TaxID=424799 RepID=A0ABS5ELG5_9PROT|nr:Hint domain-containing protein [Neoroseomonas terrae]MBR0651859.1 hypothetical protein [Neoroseomonas terrae]